ncbi:hypothetical protein BD779DRAFT_1145026 [Infundibulicybe gibba]|nr:hypothetical protein BD779DRAFT_1145026 [Infundibulicybe gibba]
MDTSITSDIPTPKREQGISCVPPEILSEIFIRCISVPFGSQDTQRLLRSVCRLWHALVLVTPALWASLHITYSTNVLHPPLHIIHTHLQRSGICPLSFVLHASDSEHLENADSHLSTVLAALTAARQRWRYVRINLIEMTQNIMDFITLGDAPLLQHIHCKASGPWDEFPIPLYMIRRCPRLELFEWNNFRSPLLQPLGGTQLTVLLLWATLTVSECITILRLSPCLSKAGFCLFDPRPSATLHLTHPVLHTLIAMGQHSTTLLSALTLPALLHLRLMAGAPPAIDWEIALTSFLAQTPTIQELILSVSPTQDLEPAILRVLAHVPHVLLLTLLNDGGSALPLTAAFIRALHPQPLLGAALCPHLHTLCLPKVSGLPDGLCGAMLRARWGARAQANGVACLEWVTIEFSDGTHDQDQADMEELYAEGMQKGLRLMNW